MRRAALSAAALGALLLALLAASNALGRGTPLVAVGGFSSQVSAGSARAGASVSARRSATAAGSTGARRTRRRPGASRAAAAADASLGLAAPCEGSSRRPRIALVRGPVR